jgi:chromosome segregation ATPase
MMPDPFLACQAHEAGGVSEACAMLDVLTHDRASQLLPSEAALRRAQFVQHLTEKLHAASRKLLHLEDTEKRLDEAISVLWESFLTHLHQLQCLEADIQAVHTRLRHLRGNVSEAA